MDAARIGALLYDARCSENLPHCSTWNNDMLLKPLYGPGAECLKILTGPKILGAPSILASLRGWMG